MQSLYARADVCVCACVRDGGRVGGCEDVVMGPVKCCSYKFDTVTPL